MDVKKKAKLVNEINLPLVSGIHNHSFFNNMLVDLDNDQRDLRLTFIAEISTRYLSEKIDDKLRINVSLRLWTDCIEAAKRIRPT